MNRVKKRFFSFFLSTGLFVAALSLSACGSSGSGDAAANASASNEKGEVVISLTDAEGDFENYEVDILSLTLTKQNGAIVETLPNTARIDFAEYVDLSEIVTTATIPLGTYTHATMVLDYSAADIRVEVAGDATPASVQDADGNAISQLEVRVKLDIDRPLVIAPGVPAHLSLDFDLKATNEVDTSVMPPLVTVEPLLIADVNPDFDDLKTHRLRGPLLEINEAEERFKIAIRPFRHKIDRDRRHFGKLEVVPNDDAVYEVNGLSARGSEGFTLLAAEPLYTAVVVIGKLNIRKRVFEAREIFAGTSVPGGDRDVVHGSVLSRKGDILILHGALFERADGRLMRHRDVTVLLGENTNVTKEGQVRDHERALNKDDISVGQRITVFGDIVLDDAVLAESRRLTVDATEGRVRLRYTTVTGVVTRSADNATSFVMALQSLNGHRVNKYDFTGTGSDPEAYIVNTGTLSLNHVVTDDPIRLRGHVSPFGETPPDFVAQTVIDVAGRNAFLAVNWKPETESALFSATVSSLELDLSGAARLHHVFRAHIATELNNEPAPQILPRAEGRGRYAIREARTVTVHNDFGNFVRDLNKRLDGEAKLRHLQARGKYASETQSMVSRLVIVGLR